MGLSVASFRLAGMGVAARELVERFDGFDYDYWMNCERGMRSKVTGRCVTNASRSTPWLRADTVMGRFITARS